MSRFTLEEYTDEEKRENGNMMKFGKLHDKICDYLEKEYILKDSQVNDISMGVWLAIESLSPYKEFVEQQQSKLKAQQQELEKARELIRLQNDILCTVYTENSATVVKAKEFLKKGGE